MPPRSHFPRANICARYDNLETVTLYDAASNRTLKEIDGARTTYSYRGSAATEEFRGGARRGVRWLGKAGWGEIPLADLGWRLAC